MRAVRIYHFGGADEVRVEDLPTPQVGTGQALVRIRAAAVNPVDWMEYDTEDLEEIARLAASGALKSHITKVLPLDKAREALDLNQGGNSHGKIVLQVA
jgi:NADPH:quinone reductase-like Zn-dependent oxidoreductase